jgi:hypothetical protein
MEVVDKLHSGYDEMRPRGQIDPGRVEKGTNAYLVPRFPKLDYIKRAIFLPQAGRKAREIAAWIHYKRWILTNAWTV